MYETPSGTGAGWHKVCPPQESCLLKQRGRKAKRSAVQCESAISEKREDLNVSWEWLPARGLRDASVTSGSPGVGSVRGGEQPPLN